MLRVFLVLVLVCVFGDGSLSGRGLFCRDPETGQLHPVNSTWTATSFCGTYHCKIRRKNLTSTEYAPIRQINITDIQLLAENATIVDIQKGEGFIKREEVLNDTVSTVNKTIPYIINNGTLNEIHGIKLKDDINEINALDKDRYLTHKEIESLTDILHMVKKSDLDALVEIYNLAQDLYKELDQTSTDLILQEVLSTPKTSEQKILQSKLLKKVKKHSGSSYWYEPLSNTKIVADLVPHDIARNDMSPEIPAMVISIKVPAANVTAKPTTKIIPPRIPSQLPPTTRATPNKGIRKDPFFNNPLSLSDFGKLPYYYPMSNFQRMSSYKHDQKKRLLDNTKTQAHKLVPILTTTPALMLSWIPKFIPAMMRMPEFMPALGEAWIPEYIPARIPKSMPGQTQAWNPARILEPEPEHTQAQRIPSGLPVRVPAPIPVRIPAPISIRIPSRMPSRIPAPIPVQAPPNTTSLQSPTPATKPAHKPSKNKPINTGSKYSKDFRPLNFLPFPFTNAQQKENWFLIQNLYSGTKFGQLKRRRTNENSDKNMITNNDNSNRIPSIKKRKGKQDNVVLMNPDLENFQDLQITASKQRENVVKPNKKAERKALERRKPAWQTDPIPEHILDEVRANIQENHRVLNLIHTLPFRKKVKLERVGKLFNIDQLTRNKRAAEDTNGATEEVPLKPEMFEVFIDKTSCDDYLVPGFFRFGNLSLPYPECCPQRIPVL